MRHYTKSVNGGSHCTVTVNLSLTREEMEYINNLKGQSVFLSERWIEDTANDLLSNYIQSRILDDTPSWQEQERERQIVAELKEI